VKLVKLLTVPAVLLVSLLTAIVPAFAHGLANATIDFTCPTGTPAGQVCVHIHGDNEEPLHRVLTFRLTAAGSTVALAPDITFKVDVASPLPADTTFDKTQCFQPASSVSGMQLVVSLVSVTDQTGAASDFQFLAKGTTKPFIDFDGANTKPIAIPGTPAVCPATAQSPSPSPPQVQSSSSPVASPVATLAQTGGFDYRWPIAGLALLVGGITLLVLSSVRRRSTDSGS
jgi:hypothetical protein